MKEKKYKANSVILTSIRQTRFEYAFTGKKILFYLLFIDLRKNKKDIGD